MNWTEFNVSPPISAEQCSTGPTANEEHQPASTDFQSTNQKTKEGTQVVKEEEKNLTSTPEKTPPTLAPPQLAQLRTENTDSFDMEEVRCSSGFSWVLPTKGSLTLSHAEEVWRSPGLHWC